MPLWKALAEVLAKYGVHDPEWVTRIHFDVNDEGWGVEVVTLDMDEMDRLGAGPDIEDIPISVHHLNPRMKEV